jgi:glycosyltransferase involved in cell wall biosynthesis
MKIVVVTHWRIPSEKTMAPYMLRVAEAFAAAGAEVEFWAPRRRNEDFLRAVDPFAYHGIERIFKIRKLPVIDLMHALPGAFGFLLMLASYTTVLFFRILLMRNRHRTVFYFFDLRDAWSALLVSRMVFSEIHMYYKSSVDFINRWGFGRSAGIIAATKALQNDIQKIYGVEDRRILHAPCAVNFERFGIDTPMGEARAHLGLPEDKKIILYVGHLFEVKGVNILFEAHSLLQEGEVIYFVGGTDADIERFKEKWRAAGEPASVKIVGRRPHQEVPLWLRAADMLTIPNTAKEAAGAIESSPSKLIEYMASGRPIIASDVPGITDVLDPTMGYVCEPDSAEAIASAVRTIGAHPEEAAARAARAREAAKQLSWESRAKKILNFIHT